MSGCSSGLQQRPDLVPKERGLAHQARVSLPCGSDDWPQRFQGSKTSSESISGNNTVFIEGYDFKLSWFFIHGDAVGKFTLCYRYMHCVLQVCTHSSSFRLSPCNSLIIPSGKRSLVSGKGSFQAPSCGRAGTARGRAFFQAQTCRTDSVGFTGSATVCVNWALCLEDWKGRETQRSKSLLSGKIWDVLLMWYNKRRKVLRAEGEGKLATGNFISFFSLTLSNSLALLVSSAVLWGWQLFTSVTFSTREKVNGRCPKSPIWILATRRKWWGFSSPVLAEI